MGFWKRTRDTGFWQMVKGWNVFCKSNLHSYNSYRALRCFTKREPYLYGELILIDWPMCQSSATTTYLWESSWRGGTKVSPVGTPNQPVIYRLLRLKWCVVGRVTWHSDDKQRYQPNGARGRGRRWSHMSKGIMGFVISFLMGQQQQTPDADRYGRCLKNASHILNHMLE